MDKTAHELTRKEMKAPDRFQVLAGEATSWLAARKKQLAVVVAVALAVVLFAVAVLTFLEARRAKAGALLSAALSVAEGEVSATATPVAGRPVFKTAEEKHRATVEAARKVRDQASGSRAALSAALLEGDAQLALGKHDEAMAAFEAYLAGAPKDDSLRFGAHDGLARAQEGKGDLAAAADVGGGGWHRGLQGPRQPGARPRAGPGRSGGGGAQAALRRAAGVGAPVRGAGEAVAAAAP